MACDGSKSGKVTFTDNNLTTEIVIPKAPFFVACSPAGSCGVSGNRTITVNVSNPAASANNGSQFTYSSFKNEVFFFKAVPQSSGTYDGNRYDLYGSCPDGERFLLAGASLMSGALSIINDVFTGDGASGLIIKDASNNTLFNIPVSQCNYKISCDNDCPNGYCKIDCEQYPGYCCISEAKIQNLTNELKS